VYHYVAPLVAVGIPEIFDQGKILREDMLHVALDADGAVAEKVVEFSGGESGVEKPYLTFKKFIAVDSKIGDPILIAVRVIATDYSHRAGIGPRVHRPAQTIEIQRVEILTEHDGAPQACKKDGQPFDDQSRFGVTQFSISLGDGGKEIKSILNKK
jgi:hypothetical protein